MRTIHDFSGILGAHIRAVIEAEAESAAATAEFIQRVGFQEMKTDRNRQELRMLSFQLPRRSNDGQIATHQVDIPLLSLLPVPLLTIDKAELSFELTIEDVVQTSQTQGPNQLTQKKSPRLLTSVAQKSKSKTTSTLTSTADLSVKITLKQGDFPLGLEKLLQLADLSSLDQLVKKEG